MRKTAQNQQVSRLYSALSGAGLGKAYLNRYLIPQALQNPLEHDSLVEFLAWHLGLNLDSLSATNPVLKFEHSKVRYFRGPETAEDKDSGELIAMAISRIAISAMQHKRMDSFPTASAVRRRILESNEPYVSFRSLIDYCWNSGVPILHVKNLPAKARKRRGIVTEVNSRPAVVLCRQDASPSRHILPLAHEIGHIAGRHLDFVGFMASTDAELQFIDRTEAEAQRYGNELITGGQTIPVDGYHYRRVEGLVDATLERSRRYKVDPGYLIISRTTVTHDWAEANLALRLIEGSTTAPEMINSEVAKRLDWGQVSAYSRDLLQGVTGLQAPRIKPTVGENTNFSEPDSSESASERRLPGELLKRYDHLVELKYTVGLSEGQEVEFKNVAEALDNADWNSPDERAKRSASKVRHKQQRDTLENIIGQLMRLQTI